MSQQAVLATPTQTTDQVVSGLGFDHFFMGHNKRTYDGPLGRSLADPSPSGLGLRKAVLHHTRRRTGTTFFQGSKPIDRLWVSSDIGILNKCVMPFGCGVGDHHLFVLDITLKSMIGTQPTRIVRPASRRLNSRVPHSAEAYNKPLKANIVWHPLIKKLQKVHVSNWLQAKKEHRVCTIDWAGKEFMTHAENVCRKIRCCSFPYLPKVSIWIRCAQVYYSLHK